MGRSSLVPWVLLGVISASVLQVCHSTPDGEEDDKPKLLYILLDGFRWDYLEMFREGALPAFNQFVKEGVRARWATSVYPSLSFPAQITLSTGLYPENHNIIGNYFYDHATKDVFALFDSQTTVRSKWWTSEPIWITAEKAGLKTAQIKWTRCEVPYDGKTTHYCETYKDEEARLDNFLKSSMTALKKLEEGYDFVQVYTVEPDLAGHYFGPKSREVLQKLQDLDSVLSIIMDELETKGLSDKVNIIITSDHGMQFVGEETGYKTIEIDSHLNTALVDKICDRYSVMYLYVSDENLQRVYNQVSRIPGLTAYKKSDIPDDFYFKRGKYVPDILLFPNSGYLIMPSASDKQVPPRMAEFGSGVHGLNPKLPSMRGIFFAKGPAFKEGLVTDPINMVDVYQVLTTVLDIPPLPHNGTWKNVEPIFAESTAEKEGLVEERGDEGHGSGASTPIMTLVLASFLVTLGRCLQSTLL
ncbi:glycerophosphocholine cholinephosphodiesterase ENPP6-like [Macrobrachium nipponense]|uniref:glycerophosphocholine cholinephosphodiesterase ENPP6-like n=1 Tax=Macrobrachium nipponense TaxID=159736 RepID=UPI0030C7F16D